MSHTHAQSGPDIEVEGGRSTLRRPVVLLYHGVPQRDREPVDGAALEEHIRFLRRHFNIVSLTDSTSQTHRSFLGAGLSVAITFDDGYRNNAEVVAPILKRHDVPATFFVCNRHARAGQYLWFSYLSALRAHFTGNGFYFQGEFFKMSRRERNKSIDRLRTLLLSLRPHPERMYEAIEAHLPRIEDFVREDDLRMHYAGLTEEQIGELANDDLFSVQAHTKDHPFLTLCEETEVAEQLQDNKAWLERIVGKECGLVAYPAGDYDARTVDVCHEAGFEYGFAVIPKRLKVPSFEIPRLGIYSKSLKALAVKTRFGHLIRACGVPVG